MRRFLACVLAALVLGGGVAAAEPQAGRDYQVLTAPQPTEGAGVEVLEFFYYGCPVCYEAQPRIERWRRAAGGDVRWRRIPAVNSEGWEPLARAYFALEAMGALERLHWPLYDGHHFDGRHLDEEANFVAWAGANGVDAASLRAALASIDTRQKVEYAKREAGRYGVRAVPSIVVAGRYLTTARMAGGVEEMMGVVQFLVERARRERAAR